MSDPHGILIFGPNGSGKTMLGREVARALGFFFMDIEAHAFEESTLPYSAPRTAEEVQRLLLNDIEQHLGFVLSAVTGDFGDAITQRYKLAVYLSAPMELRLERVRQRQSEKFGERVQEGGDMYESEEKFMAFVASRDLTKIDDWARTLPCPILRLDGTVDWRDNARHIAMYYASI